MTVGQERSYGAMALVSMLVLFLEAVLALVVGVVHFETLPVPNPWSGFTLGPLTLPFLLVAGAVVGAAVSWLLVLPTVWLSDVLGRRLSGRAAWWWVPLVAAAGLAPVGGYAALGASPLTALGWWLVGTAALTVPALLCRVGRRGMFGSVALWGTLVVLSAATVGAAAPHTGLVERYRPPVLTRDALVGTWTDGGGGTVTFAADGAVSVSGGTTHSLDTDFAVIVGKCAGAGTWTFEAARDAWAQKVHTAVEDCAWDPWYVGGTRGRVVLYQYVGDPDSPDVHALTKAP
ncbi:hypothetical protein [Streptomyces thermolilacinus]|uniref:hypothetical protein n=1 Tax=Streptomyces thermolilacinus TaxID=285540 RepID=UPI0033F3214E